MIKVGDFITAYHKGYHIVTKVCKAQYNNGNLIYYYSILDSNGCNTARRGNHCHECFCKPIDIACIEETYKEELTTAINKRNSLIDILNKAQNGTLTAKKVK